MPTTTVSTRVALPLLQLDAWGSLTVIDPAVGALQDLLTYGRPEYLPGGPMGYHRTITETSLFTFDHRGRMVVPTGLLPRLMEHLNSAGYPITVVDHRRFPSRQQVAPEMLGQLVGDDQTFGQAVDGNPMGQIEVGNTAQLIHYVGTICQLFSTARIAVIAATRRRARYLCRTLTDRLDTQIGLAVSGQQPGPYRVMVATPLQLNAMQSGQLQILLLADAGEAGGELVRAVVALHSSELARVYAFRFRNRRLNNSQNLCLEAMAGPIIYGAGPEMAHVRVHICPVASPAIRISGVGLERKRQAIWHHSQRNDQVAASARAAVDGDIQGLWQMGLMLEEPEDLLHRYDGTPRVVVLVESTEHGRELQRRLPGWVMLHDATAQHCPENNDPCNGTIVTLTYAARHGIRADILLRADGGNGNLDISGFPPTRTESGSGQVIVVDYADDYDGRAQQNTQERMRGYARNGWVVVGQRQASCIHDSNTTIQVIKQHAVRLDTEEANRVDDCRSAAAIPAADPYAPTAGETR